MKNVIYFTVDETFLPIALANALTLIGEKNRKFDVVILLRGSPSSSLSVPEGVRILANDLDRLVPAEIDTVAPWGRVAYTRIFAPQMLAREYRRALYLDADVAIFGDVSALFTLDMKGQPLAAVEGMMDESAALQRVNLVEYKAGLGIRDGRTFNSGVLLMDIPEWNQINHAAMLRQYANETQPRLVHRIGMAGDQDYLNFAMRGRWLGLSPRWNFQTFLLRYALEELLDPVIVHYGGPRRPWHELLFPYGDRHTEYFSGRLRRVGFTDLAKIRPRSYYRRFLADQVRQLVHNRLRTISKRRMFKEWQSMRTTFKNAIESRLRAGQYEDVQQGISSIDISKDSFASATLDDVVYFRKRIRLRHSF